MASDDENYNSDNEINTEKHSRLLEEVLQLDKKQFVKKPTRTEPTSQVSEFNLVKSSSGKQNTVHIGDLTKSLEKVKKYGEVSKKIKAAQTKIGVLRKPLEKPQRERIKRSLGFKEVKSDLEKWDPIVIKNRVTTQLHFPLDHGQSMEIHKGNRKLKPGFDLKFKTPLDIELEKLEPVIEPEEKVIETFPLTLKEIMDKRREMARLRAQQSYQEAKYRRQNKIKSKKFHRIARKEKIKTQIKEFETLQKTDPEEALKKLEEIERARAEERMSLRHKSTGQWAKNKVVRAKYDKESRQNLAQQLAISRELTQKLRTESSSESEGEENIEFKNSDPSNPWTNTNKTEQEIDDFLSGYRKFWENQNQNKMGNQIQNEVQVQENGHKNVEMNSNLSSEDEEATEVEKEVIPPKIETQKLKKRKTVQQERTNNKKSPKKKQKVKKVNLNSTTEWEVEDLQDDNDNRSEESLEEIFDDLEGSIAQNKLKKKLDHLKKIDEDLENASKTAPTKPVSKKVKKSNKKSKTSTYMELPKEKYRIELDEELIMEDEVQNPLRKLSQLSSDLSTTKTNGKMSQNSDIDPNKYLNLGSTHLETFLPNNIDLGDDNQSNDGDESGGEDQRDIITEAFAGDDVVADFAKEKKDLIDSEKPQDIDLTLPGWGTWGGKNVKQPSKRKRRRFIVKFPKKMPRRDENRGQVIINETKNEKLSQHLVTEVPFPFKSVKEYEASIRAPIGDTFVPQTAFRRYIKPAVVTKKGEVIKPMDTEVLVKHKFTKNGMVVKR